MSESSPQGSTRRADLFLVPCGPLPPDQKLIEWPEDEAEAAALVAQCKRIGDDLRALQAAPDHDRWHEASVKVLVAVRYYLGAHPDAARIVDDRLVFSDGFRNFVLALASPGRPGEGMPLAELAFCTTVPQRILKGWLSSQAD